MTKFFAKWKETPLSIKAATGIVLVSSILIIVLTLLQLFGVWRDAALAYMPLLCVNMLAQAFSSWKTNRSTAIVSLVAAGIILVCVAAVVYLRFAAA